MKTFKTYFIQLDSDQKNLKNLMTRLSCGINPSQYSTESIAFKNTDYLVGILHTSSPFLKTGGFSNEAANLISSSVNFDKIEVFTTNLKREHHLNTISKTFTGYFKIGRTGSATFMNSSDVKPTLDEQGKVIWPTSEASELQKSIIDQSITSFQKNELEPCNTGKLEAVYGIDSKSKPKNKSSSPIKKTKNKKRFSI